MNQENSPEPQNKRALSILVVEDNQINLRLLMSSLIRIGHQVDKASDGQAAIEKFLANKYDVILMDIMMPVMDGVTATKEIRKLELEKGIREKERVKIIAVTANALEDERDKFLAAGMDEMMNKPIDIEELHRFLHLD
ncbi:MAG: response regulator [bacterium]